MVLRDSFISKSDKSKIIMIACVSPCMTSSNHSINTLRYSDRLKEKSNKPKSQFIQLEVKNMNEDKKNTNMKEIEDININIFHDDNLKEMEFDNIIYDEDNYFNINSKLNNEKTTNSGKDWEYLKKTVQSKDGKTLSDDFIRYHQITDQLVEDEDLIVNLHMNIIKEDAKLLLEEGDLISNIKGFSNDSDKELDIYIEGLEKIINKKIQMFSDLKTKIDIYKNHIKEEDEIRSKLNPKYFIEN